MGIPSRPRAKLDWLVLVFLFAVFLLASPAVRWWATGEYPWFVPYGLWLVLVGLVAWMYGRGDRNDD